MVVIYLARFNSLIERIEFFFSPPPTARRHIYTNEKIDSEIAKFFKSDCPPVILALG